MLIRFNGHADSVHKTIFHTETFVWGYFRSCARALVQANETKLEGRCGNSKKRHEKKGQMPPVHRQYCKCIIDCTVE